MTQEHPITPPPELVVEWADTIYQQTECGDQRDLYVATQAAQWGADTELEACCSQLAYWGVHGYNKLYEARRPKPPNLKEQALGALYAIATGADDTREFHQDLETIKQALESLPE